MVFHMSHLWMARKHGSTLKLMGKMLAEADDFWPVPVDDNPDVQEILSAVIAFKEPGQRRF
jgi:hypothetical protein